VSGGETGRIDDLSERAARAAHRIGGGLPVTVDGQVVGGIGISSGTAIEDQACAEAALSYFREQTGYRP